MPHQLAPLSQDVPNGVPSVLPSRLATLDLAQRGPRRGSLPCLPCGLGGLLPVGGLGRLGGSPGLLLRGRLGGLLPRSSASFLLILAAGLLLRFPGCSAGLFLILPAGLLLYRRRVQADLPPAIPMRGAADMLQLRFVAGDMLQLSLVTVAGPARTRPMPDDDAMGPPDGGLGPRRTPRVGRVRGDCHRHERAERRTADERCQSSCRMPGFGVGERPARGRTCLFGRLSWNLRPT